MFDRYTSHTSTTTPDPPSMIIRIKCKQLGSYFLNHFMLCLETFWHFPSKVFKYFLGIFYKLNKNIIFTNFIPNVIGSQNYRKAVSWANLGFYTCSWSFWYIYTHIHYAACKHGFDNFACTKGTVLRPATSPAKNSWQISHGTGRAQCGIVRVYHKNLYRKRFFASVGPITILLRLGMVSGDLYS